MAKEQKKEKASIFSFSGLMLILGMMMEKVTAEDEGISVGKWQAN